MNKKQRNKNRSTALWLKYQQKCTRCGTTGLHYVYFHIDAPEFSSPILNGFWTCPDLYDKDGRRIED